VFLDHWNSIVIIAVYMHSLTVVMSSGSGLI